MKKKKVMSLIALIAGILILTLGVVSVIKFNSKKTNKDNAPTKELGVIPEDDPDNDHLVIKNFKYEKIQDYVKVTFTKINQGDEAIINKSLYINFYNGDELLISYPHEWEKLDILEEVEVEELVPLIYDGDITDCKLIYNDYLLIPTD